MRTTKELFELLLEEREQNKKTFFHSTCMCQLINHMSWSEAITKDEAKLLFLYLNNNAPDHIKKRVIGRQKYLPNFVERPMESIDKYWWPENNWDIRIDWIIEQITLLS